MADKKTKLMAEFYDQCQAKGYTDMSDATQSLKAKVIATDLGLKYKKIDELYAKAQQCAEIVRREEEEAKAAAEKKAEEERVLAEKRAVDGKLILELVDSEAGSYGKSVQVYRRPDGSLYSLIPPSTQKIEGAPSIAINSGSSTVFTYTPSKTVYTSASVGGITTGGVSTIAGGYSPSTSNSGKGYLTLSLSSTSFTIKRCLIPDDVRFAFRRDPTLKSRGEDGEIKLFQKSSTADLYRSAMFAPGKDAFHTMSALSLAVDEERLMFSSCSRILDLIMRIINGPWPPTDRQLFDEACSLSESDDLATLEKALKTLATLADGSELSVETVTEKRDQVQARYDELLQAQKEAAILQKEADAKKTKKILSIAIPAVAAVVALVLLLTLVVIPGNKYKKANELYDNGQYREAAVVFYDLGNYRDSRARSFDIWSGLAKRETLCAGFSHTVGLREDGTVVAVGSNDSGQCNVDRWRDIIAISAGTDHTVGLRADGTVVAVGSNKYGQCDVRRWTDIVAISAGETHTVGLRADGTIVAAGQDNLVSFLTDIVAVSARIGHAVGLREDGTVVAVGSNVSGECNVNRWTDIVAISAGTDHTVGLRADGTVVAVGSNEDGQCDVGRWTDIVAISAGRFHTVGLRADGTVVAVGANDFGERDVERWTDIVAISAGSNHTVGLRADGTVVAVGLNMDGECDVRRWTDNKLPG